MKINTNADIEEFIESLDVQTTAKVLRTLDLLEKFAHKLTMPHTKKITANLFELRTRGRQEVRIIYCFYNNQIYLLSGFVKKSDKIPIHELKKAEAKYSALTIL